MYNLILRTFNLILDHIQINIDKKIAGGSGIEFFVVQPYVGALTNDEKQIYTNILKEYGMTFDDGVSFIKNFDLPAKNLTLTEKQIRLRFLYMAKAIMTNTFLIPDY